ANANTIGGTSAGDGNVIANNGAADDGVVILDAATVDNPILGNSIHSNGDGVADEDDAFPLDPAETQDSDGDGVGDEADAFPDDPEETTDTDLDGLGDNADPDDDNDGLLDTVECSGVTTLRAEQILLEWVERHQAAGLYMAGSGVHFDRRWLRRWMPALVRVWHYRNFDMTTLRYFFDEEKKTTKHRALGDLRQNVADLRRLLGYRLAATA
ncbi:hypothetical protein LCGC14_3130970, partial [marine sediment metagenome]